MGLNDNNRISILLVTDDYYAILLAAFLKSIEMNHKTDEIIDAYIIDDNISAPRKPHLFLYYCLLLLFGILLINLLASLLVSLPATRKFRHVWFPLASCTNV